jgi:hypothetical protein
MSTIEHHPIHIKAHCGDCTGDPKHLHRGQKKIETMFELNLAPLLGARLSAQIIVQIAIF